MEIGVQWQTVLFVVCALNRQMGLGRRQEELETPRFNPLWEECWEALSPTWPYRITFCQKRLVGSGLVRLFSDLQLGNSACCRVTVPREPF